MITLDPVRVHLHANPQDDPAEVGAWAARCVEAFREEQEAARVASGAIDGDQSDQDTSEPAITSNGVTELLARWTQFNPGNADRLSAVVSGLTELGYTLALSEPRTGKEQRTYVRALRSDGTSAGYINSARFIFVGTRDLVSGESNVKSDSQYPTIAWTTDDAVETVLKVAKAYASA